MSGDASPALLSSVHVPQIKLGTGIWQYLLPCGQAFPLTPVLSPKERELSPFSLGEGLGMRVTAWNR
jgi:hypothetical protein